MKAYLHSVRIAPKKANLVAKMVRGMPVPDAMDALIKTNKKAARIIEQLLRSAMANASHNEKQDPQTMVIKTIVVNQGTALHRGTPMARGRVRPMKKFMSHIEMTLGFPEVEGEEKNQKSQKKQKNQKKGTEGASQNATDTVKMTKLSAKKQKETSTKSSSSESSVSSDSSVS